LRLRPEPKKLQEWNKGECSKLHEIYSSGQWTKLLEELFPPRILEGIKGPKGTKQERRQELLTQLYNLSRLEEEYLQDKVGPEPHDESACLGASCMHQVELHGSSWIGASSSLPKQFRIIAPCSPLSSPRSPSSTHIPINITELTQPNHLPAHIRTGDSSTVNFKSLEIGGSRKVKDLIEESLLAITSRGVKYIVEALIRGIFPYKRATSPYPTGDTTRENPCWWPDAKKCRFKAPDRLDPDGKPDQDANRTTMD
jgi:hypothetical protein